jgi:hypothetical protein
VQYEYVWPIGPDRCKDDRCAPCRYLHLTRQALNGGRDRLSDEELQYVGIGVPAGESSGGSRSTLSLSKSSCSCRPVSSRLLSCARDRLLFSREMHVRRALGKVKDLFVRDERRYHQVLRGMSRGFELPLNLRHDFGQLIGINERDLAPHIRALVQPGKSAIDVGAAYGAYTLALSRMTGAPVVAVEAEGELCEMLRMTVQRNAARLGSIKVVEAFVSDKSDERHVTLDQLAARVPTVGLVKMDIEGGEVAALAGAETLLGSIRPNWVIEVHGYSQESACLLVLEDFGYSTRFVSEALLFKEQRPLAHNRWLLARPKRN